MIALFLIVPVYALAYAVRDRGALKSLQQFAMSDGSRFDVEDTVERIAARLNKSQQRRICTVFNLVVCFLVYLCGLCWLFTRYGHMLTFEAMVRFLNSETLERIFEVLGHMHLHGILALLMVRGVSLRVLAPLVLLACVPHAGAFVIPASVAVLPGFAKTTTRQQRLVGAAVQTATSWIVWTGTTTKFPPDGCRSLKCWRLFWSGIWMWRLLGWSTRPSIPSRTPRSCPTVRSCLRHVASSPPKTRPGSMSWWTSLQLSLRGEAVRCQNLRRRLNLKLLVITILHPLLPPPQLKRPMSRPLHLGQRPTWPWLDAPVMQTFARWTSRKSGATYSSTSGVRACGLAAMSSPLVVCS